MSRITTDILRYAAFTKDGIGGNPAGVVLDACGLSDEEMLNIAAQVGYSETAFITERSSAGVITVRYFSPLAEVAFCGHATIALSAAFAEHEGSEGVILKTKAGEVAVDIRRDGAGTILATLTSVPTHTREASANEVALALEALRWTSDDLDTRYPVHVAYAGEDHLIVAVKDRQTLAALDYDYPSLATLMAKKDWTTVHAIWAETPVLFHARAIPTRRSKRRSRHRCCCSSIWWLSPNPQSCKCACDRHDYSRRGQWNPKSAHRQPFRWRP